MSTWALSILLDCNASHSLLSSNEVKTTIKLLTCQFRDRARADEDNIVDANAFVPLHAIIDKLTRVREYDSPYMAERVLKGAAKAGNVDALKWAAGAGFRSQRDWAIAACEIGQFDALEWLFASRWLKGGLNFTACVVAAAEMGRMDVLGWLRARSGEMAWDWDQECVVAALSVATDHQQFQVLDWLFAEFGSATFAQQVCSRALSKGYVGVAKWAVRRGAAVVLRPRELMMVIVGRKSAMLRWLLEEGHASPDHACIIGAVLAGEE